MQDVQASIEGLVAIVQSGGNGKVSADVSLFGTGVLDGDHLVNIVLSGGHTQRILLALRGADDGVQLLVLLEVLKSSSLVALFIGHALLLDQVDFYVSNCKCVGGFISIGEVGERCAHDGDGHESDTQEDGCQFLFHVCFAPFM